MLKTQNNKQIVINASAMLIAFICLVLFNSPVNAKNKDTIDEITKNFKLEIKKTPVAFSIEKGTPNEALASQALKDIIPQAEAKVGRHINLATSRIDLNEDGIKELFVRILDDDLFCNHDVCSVLGFALTQSGLVKIAEFKARTIDALSMRHNGAKDLLVSLSPEGSGTVYTWQDNFYKEKKR